MRLTWILPCLLGCCFLPGWILSPSPGRVHSASPSPGVSATLSWFKAEAPRFTASCTRLEKAIQAIDTANPSSIITAKQSLADCRLSYKKIEAFLEYFFQNSAHVYNSPPKYEPEEPVLEYQEPVGLQVIEALLFDKDIAAHKQELVAQADVVASSSTGLVALLYDFPITDDQVLESLRLEIVRIMTLGIVGYDAPFLRSGIRESHTALASLQTQLQPWLTSGEPRSDSLLNCLDQAIQFLDKPVTFDDFDRLHFLRDYAAPLQYQLGAFIRERGLEKNTNGTLNYDAPDLFHPAALNLTKISGTAPAPEQVILLGKTLFRETALSGNNRKSCASCHAPEKYFTDGLDRSIAFDGHSLLPRNAPTLLYCGFQYSQFWDGRVRSLEDQIRTVLKDPREMHADSATILKKLRASHHYDSLFRTAFAGSLPGTTLSLENITQALAGYVRSLHPMNSPYDRYMQGDRQALSPAQIRGANLFLGKAQCATCHFLPLFNGLIPPDYKFTESEVLGTTATGDLTHPVRSSDPGKYAIYPLAFNQGAFKTPTVRNAAATAPYMHNGAFADLEKLMDFYNKGGGAGLGLTIPEQTLPAAPLQLQPEELKDIIQFINALTDSLPNHISSNIKINHQ